MKKKKIIIITITIFITLLITLILLTSYAYWRVSKIQSGTNQINGACLSIVLEEDGANGFTLEKAWPISDGEGIDQNGYHFKIINSCEESITYRVVLDSLEINNPMSDQYVKVAIDNGPINTYDELEEETIVEDISYTPKASKVVFNGQIPGSKNNTVGEIEHTIKIWISSESPNEEIGKNFSSKIRVIAGQELSHPQYAVTPGECFEFESETGTITGYDEENCTTEYLVVPQKINGVMVKNIDWNNGGSSTGCYAAWGYVDLTNATGLKTIGDNAFPYYVGDGRNLIIPEGVETIGNFAFDQFVQDADRIQRIVLPSTIKHLGVSAVNNITIDVNMSESEFNYVQKDPWWTNASVINYLKSEYPVTPESCFDFDYSTRTITGYHEDECTTEYLTLPSSINGTYVNIIDWYDPDAADGCGDACINWDYVGLSRAGELSLIGDNAFLNFNGKNLVLGRADIGSNAFADYVATIEKKLIIPEGVNEIKAGAFHDAGLSGAEVILPSTIRKLEYEAFRNSTKVSINMSEEDFNTLVDTDVGWCFGCRPTFLK